MQSRDGGGGKRSRERASSQRSEASTYKFLGEVPWTSIGQTQAIYFSRVKFAYTDSEGDVSGAQNPYATIPISIEIIFQEHLI